MNEDDIYRTSTQYRFWSFTEKGLADLRSTTNSLATSRVRDAIKRQRASEAKSGEDEVDCLSVQEEQKLVGFYCSKAMDFSDFCNFPTAVKATAVQFMKRFYLSNSPMTYHPKQMMPSAIYLATKTENYYVGVKDFAGKLPKTTTDAIIAPEFLLTQGLRFTFDVRHPYRGLEGGTMELNEMALGSYVPPAGSALTAGEVQARMLALGGGSGSSSSAPDKAGSKPAVEAVQERIKKAHDKAGELLKTSAILTDAYFLYTPSQIWMSALLAADEPMTLLYLHVMLSAAAAAPSATEPSALELKIVQVLRRCAALLTSSTSRKPGDEEKKDLMRIDKKLYQCRNPEKVDLIGMDKAAKSGLGGEDEKIVKKRKLERDRAVREEADIFGAQLSK